MDEELPLESAAPQRHSLTVGVLIAGVLACMVLGFVVSARHDQLSAQPGSFEKIPGTTTVPASVAIPHSDETAVKEWLRQNVHDTTGLEFVSWGPHGVDDVGNKVVRLRFRSRNALGAKVLSDQLFAVRDGKVLRSFENHWGDAHPWQKEQPVYRTPLAHWLEEMSKQPLTNDLRPPRDPGKNPSDPANQRPWPGSQRRQP